MRMIVDPLTGRRLSKTTRLEFNWKSMRFEPLTSGERFIQIIPLKEKEKVQVVKGHKLEFDPLKGKYVLLKKGEKLQYAYKGCEYMVKRKRKLFEWLKLLLSPKGKKWKGVERWI